MDAWRHNTPQRREGCMSPTAHQRLIKIMKKKTQRVEVWYTSVNRTMEPALRQRRPHSELSSSLTPLSLSSSSSLLILLHLHPIWFHPQKESIVSRLPYGFGYRFGIPPLVGSLPQRIITSSNDVILRFNPLDKLFSCPRARAPDDIALEKSVAQDI